MKIEVITRDEYIKRTKYWNKYYEDYCVLCGRTEVDIERVLVSEEPRPDEWSKRHIVEETSCISHFI